MEKSATSFIGLRGLRQPLGAILACALAPAFAQGQLQNNFEADFTGNQPWNFDGGTTDPSGQIGGTGQLVYSTQTTNDTAFVEQSLDFGSADFGSFQVQGEVNVNFDIFQADGFDTRYFLEIGRSGDGDQGVLDAGEPTFFRLGVEDFDTTDEKLRFRHSADNRFWNDEANSTSINDVGTDTVFEFASLIEVIDAGAGQIIVRATTTITSGALGVDTTFTSEEERGAGSGNSLSDANSLRLGFAPDGTNPNGGTFEVNSVSVIPEPSAYVFVFGLLATAMAFLRRRR